MRTILDVLRLLLDTGLSERKTARSLVVPRLLPALEIARSDGTYGKVLTQLGKADLLILDDWGLAPIGDRERRDLLEMIEDRTGRRATLLTSQVPVEHWHECVGDATFGDAILDRLVHHAPPHHPDRRLSQKTRRDHRRGCCTPREEID